MKSNEGTFQKLRGGRFSVVSSGGPPQRWRSGLQPRHPSRRKSVNVFHPGEP